jgi:hypothetical protein
MPEAAWTPALDADGRGRDGAWVFATDQPGRDLARLELRHCRHARVEDPVRAATATGLGRGQPPWRPGSPGFGHCCQRPADLHEAEAG